MEVVEQENATVTLENANVQLVSLVQIVNNVFLVTLVQIVNVISFFILFYFILFYFLTFLKIACPNCGQGTCNAGINGNGQCACKTGWVSNGGNCNACATGYYGSSCSGNKTFLLISK